jgi:vancomycin permeability regulator SanA
LVLYEQCGYNGEGRREMKENEIEKGITVINTFTDFATFSTTLGSVVFKGVRSEVTGQHA